jgi:hypothetical protein
VGSLNPPYCDVDWRQAEANMGDWGAAGFLPVTRAQIVDATMQQPTCGTFTIECGASGAFDDYAKGDAGDLSTGAL